MWQEIEIDKLRRAEWNYKIDDAIMAEKLKENIRRNGVIVNLIVRQMADGAFEVLDGNHRLDALLELGIDKVMCFNLGEIPDHQAKRIAIEINETKFPYDTNKTAELINDLISEYSVEDLALTFPFSEKEIESFLTMSLSETDSFSEADYKDKSNEIAESEYEVVISCKSETEAQELYERMTKEGYSCRVLTL